MSEYDVAKAREAQAKYCEEKGYPHFAPKSGICWRCNRNIYEPVGWKRDGWVRIQVPIDSPEKEFVTGITVEKAATELITGCPHCNRSYCD